MEKTAGIQQKPENSCLHSIRVITYEKKIFRVLIFLILAPTPYLNARVWYRLKRLRVPGKKGGFGRRGGSPRDPAFFLEHERESLGRALPFMANGSRGQTGSHSGLDVSWKYCRIPGTDEPKGPDPGLLEYPAFAV